MENSYFFHTISLFIYNLVANFPLLLHQLKLYIEYHQEIQNIQSPDQKEVSVVNCSSVNMFAKLVSNGGSELGLLHQWLYDKND